MLWWPARAALGDGEALLLLLACALLLLGAVMAGFSARFADTAVRASTSATSSAPQLTQHAPFDPDRGSRRCGARNSSLLGRDPWLVSQSLMQLLYLVPPALLLWRSFSDSSVAIILITPVIVMAAGQLAGGLGWLTISGEDAPDLVTAAPLPPSRLIRAKIEVVLLVIGALFAPLVLALTVCFAASKPPSPRVGVLVAAASATAIQLWFRVQARRSQFRRRQTSSRLATFAEAFSSIGWAATSALALTLPVAALVTGAMTLALLAATWKFSPRRELSAFCLTPYHIHHRAANASGSSCGRLCPACGIMRWARRRLNFAA